MNSGYEQRRALGAFGVAVLATALFAAWLGWSIGGETATLYGDDLGTVLAALTATLLCLHAGIRQPGRLRRFWWLLAGACGAWTLGEGIWGVYELVLRAEVPVPSWADVGYLSGIPLAVAALLAHPAMRGRRTLRVRSLLDGLAIATALLFLSWTLVLGPLWRSTDLSTLGGVVALAYPFGDVVIVCFIVLAVRRMPKEDRLPLWCLLGGLLATALSDSTYAYLTEVESYTTGKLLDAGWVAGYLGIALGAFCSGAGALEVRRSDASLPGLASLVVPFLPLLAALGVVGVEIELGRRPDRVALVMAFMLVALVLARQALLLWDMVARQGEREGGPVERLLTALIGEVPEAARLERSPQPSAGRAP